MLILALVIFCASSAELFAQSSYSSSKSADEAIRLRSTRDSAVAHCGSNAAARNFVESEEFGNEAAKALLNCSPEAGSQFAVFFDSGGLAKLARPKELLVLISEQSNADEIVKWIVEHQSELTDQDAADAFIAEPHTFLLSLRKLSTVAQERKAKRLENAGQPDAHWSLGSFTESYRQPIARCAVFAGLVLLVRWFWKRRFGDLTV
jgi:hypothetical protein